jgi:glutamate N-acetyltransferase/amino-acid N-acetyltransferase
MAILLSSGKKSVSSEEEFADALASVYRDLAEDVVRNGEGTGHVIRTVVRGAPDTSVATEIGKAIANSPLVKTAAFGNDPNVGRLIMAVGDYAGNSGLELDREAIVISIGGEVVFKGGSFTLDAEKEKRMFDHMKEAQLDPERGAFPEHNRRIEIELDLGSGNAGSAVLGSDLSYGYVRENADYRT